MCKHILNAQVAIRSPCCRKWFDCAECHYEQESHPLMQSFDMTFACKKCKKCFRKDTSEFEDSQRDIWPLQLVTNVNSDEYCPHCDNHFVIEAKTPTPALRVEGEDARIDSRFLKDDRVRGTAERSIFNVRDAADRLG
ncbi:hypothetical protein DTO164E3_6193 [Paecilomyces variotii]|nr:hypothetical protein DTO164E3_6193 [Paecilomyces variotii]KAJ9205191.1 hypothetical protein DTO032I3_2394 [Paecilomyces variotii]KAJ9248515.1 hypothetical protein DTO207G8_7294 [Paecilomyces variotii]KAJ9280295.1 hypothetical protein DTO021D3_2883 [Paecilomyces variotii]KAJ9343109.1 hypothetical protein DTO027B6_4384 [Paecilomyces variotii]